MIDIPRLPVTVPGVLIAVLIFAGGCRNAPEHSPFLPRDMVESASQESLPPGDSPDLSDQITINVHLVLWREQVRADRVTPRPYAGFTFRDGRLVPRDDIALCAGLQIPQARYDAWLNSALRAGEARLAAAHQFVGEPGQDAVFTQTKTTTYIANWRFDTEGIAAPRPARFAPGMRLHAQADPIGGRNGFRVRLEMDLRSGDIVPCEIAPAKRARRGDTLPSLAVGLPHVHVRRLITTAPVAEGCAAVVAHWAAQPGSAEAPAEHVLFVVSAARSGRWDPADAPSLSVAPTPTHTATFLWDSPGPDIEPHIGADALQASQIVVSACDRASAVRTLRTRARAGAALLSAGIAVAEGCSFALEMTEERAHVSGIEPLPANTAQPTRAFRVHTVQTGVRIEAAPVRREGRLVLQGECRMGGPIALTHREENRPSVRQPLGGAISESYRFNDSRQAVAEGAYRLDTVAGDTWMLALPWRVASNGVCGVAARAPTRLLLAALRPAPDPPAVAHEGAAAPASASAPADKP